MRGIKPNRHDLDVVSWIRAGMVCRISPHRTQVGVLPLLDGLVGGGGPDVGQHPLTAGRVHRRRHVHEQLVGGRLRLPQQPVRLLQPAVARSLEPRAQLPTQRGRAGTPQTPRLIGRGQVTARTNRHCNSITSIYTFFLPT